MIRQLILLSALTLPTTALAQAYIECVSPPSLGRGGQTRLTVLGTDLDQAQALWTTIDSRIGDSRMGNWLSATLIESSPSRAVVDVDVDAAAPLGLFGLRLATASGLSNAHLFVVDDLPPRTERDIDDAASDLAHDRPPEAITLPAAIAGIYRADDEDIFAIDVDAGQRVSFEVVGNRLGKDFDALVVIRDADGRQVAARDNDVGLFFDCRFEHTFREAGTYTVEVRDARYKGSDYLTYLLRMGSYPSAVVALPSSVQPGEKATLKFPQLGGTFVSFRAPERPEHGRFYYAFRRPGDDASTWLPLLASELGNALESEPNRTPEEATVVSVPAHLHGVLQQAGDRDWFAFDLQKGQQLRFVVESKSLGSPADIVLVLQDSTGKQVARGDDSGLDEARFDFTSEATGRYRLRVSDLTGQGRDDFVYRVEVKPRLPEFTLEARASRLAVPRGTYQPLPFYVTRRDFSGALELSLVGAPGGVTLRKTIFPEGTSELENVVDVSADTPLGVYTIQVVARGKVGERELIGLARTHPLIDRVPTGRGPHGEPFVHREDQRALPPTLTDRIALQVTPAPPYTFEVSSDVVTLPRFLEATYGIKISRSAGFDAPIDFVTRGFLIDPNGMDRRTVLSEIPTASAGEAAVSGRLRSTVISPAQPVQTRITITGEAFQEGRRTFLTRTFQMHLRPAFQPTAEPERVEVRPGDSMRVRIVANRLLPFNGPLRVNLGKMAGLKLPETVTVPAGQEAVEIEVETQPDLKPGEYSISLGGVARINKFEESYGGKKLLVVVGKEKAD